MLQARKCKVVSFNLGHRWLWEN